MNKQTTMWSCPDCRDYKDLLYSKETKQALRQAVIALQRWNKIVAFDAAIHERFKEDNPTAANAAKTFAQNNAAMAQINKMLGKEAQDE